MAQDKATKGRRNICVYTLYIICGWSHGRRNSRLHFTTSFGMQQQTISTLCRLTTNNVGQVSDWKLQRQSCSIWWFSGNVNTTQKSRCVQVDNIHIQQQATKLHHINNQTSVQYINKQNVQCVRWPVQRCTKRQTICKLPEHCDQP